MGAKRGTGLSARLGCLAARLFVLGVRLMPWCVSRALARSAGWLMHLLDRRHRRIALEAVARAFPELTPAEQRVLVRRCYRHISLAAVEFARLASLPREQVAALWALTPEQERLFAELAAAPGCAIYVTGHVGLWELSGMAYSARGLPVCSIARPINNVYINDLVDGIRQRFGQRILAKRGALRAALHALRDGVPVGMLLDQDAGKRGVFVPLFGRPASSLPTAAEVALRTGATILCVTAWRDEAAGVHRARFGKVIRPGKWELPRDERYRREVRRITAEYTAELEAAVREHPEQWLWPHRRWKTRPPEETS
jgi:KDO2-lipid IV(A) lauroyltransferase